MPTKKPRATTRHVEYADLKELITGDHETCESFTCGGKASFRLRKCFLPLQITGVRLQNRTNIFSWSIYIDNISEILQFLYSFFNFVMETKITATVTSLNKVGPTINQSHGEYSRFLVTISLIVTANSYLGAQKASQTRLFQPCFFKQVQTAG